MEKPSLCLCEAAKGEKPFAMAAIKSRRDTAPQNGFCDLYTPLLISTYDPNGITLLVETVHLLQRLFYIYLFIYLLIFTFAPCINDN